MTEQTQDPIQAAIAAATAARAAAAAAVPTPGTAVASPVNTAVGAPAQKFTMEQMMAGGMSVDKWFKVNEDGIKIGDSKLINEDIIVTLDMTDGRGFVVKQGIKGGNPAQYAYTVDGVNATSGGPWSVAMQRIQQLAPGAAPYRAVDLPMTLTTDLKDVGGKEAGKVGDVVGYTTSTTNWSNWQAFYQEVSTKGLLNHTVKVKLTAQPRVNKAGNNWGVMKFELLGEAEQSE